MVSVTNRTIMIAVIGAVLVFGLLIISNASGPSMDFSSETIQLYRSPTCGCCHNYESYLDRLGFEVTSTVMDDMSTIKAELGVPADIQSCHSMKMGNYFIEGHVPIEAIQKLLDEQPDIDGIGIPGMPSGAPGMGGTKRGEFVVYAVSNGETSEFMRV